MSSPGHHPEALRGRITHLDAIRGVAEGRRYLDDAEVRLASRRLRDSEEGRLEDLTAQERRIFDLIGEGHTNRQIAQEMYLAEKTVKIHRGRVMEKMEVGSVAALATGPSDIQLELRITQLAGHIERPCTSGQRLADAARLGVAIER